MEHSNNALCSVLCSERYIEREAQMKEYISRADLVQKLTAADVQKSFREMDGAEALLLLEMGTRIARMIRTKRAKKQAKKAVDEIIKKLGEELAGK